MSSVWTALDWDSEVLEVRAGRLVSFPIEGARLERSIQTQDFEFVCCRVPADDFRRIGLLQEAGFRMVDGLVTLAFDLTWQKILGVGGGSCRIRRAIPGDLPNLQALARVSFEFDRFHADPRISQESADQIRVAWIENSSRGRETIWCAVWKKDLVGFITHVDGAIGLLGVHPDFRRQGVGSALVEMILRRSRGLVETIETSTQISNIPALRLYLKMGFKPVRSEVTFHKWLKY